MYTCKICEITSDLIRFSKDKDICMACEIESKNNGGASLWNLYHPEKRKNAKEIRKRADNRGVFEYHQEAIKAAI